MKDHPVRNDEFYIGYETNSPEGIARFVKWVMLAVAAILVFAAFIVAWNQLPFTPNNFEYGIPTTLTGIYSARPVPNLKIAGDSVGRGKRVLLLGFGKQGAVDVITRRETNLSTKLDGRTLSITGNMIYGEGKALMQINSTEDIVLLHEQDSSVRQELFTVMSKGEMEGEIVDPKCYFGVMKPGNGKVHRSCAVRCISGGIPAVMHSQNDFFIIVDNDMQTINATLLPIIGDQIKLNGSILKLDDWNIMQVDGRELEKIRKAASQRRTFLSMNEGMTICN